MSLKDKVDGLEKEVENIKGEAVVKSNKKFRIPFRFRRKSNFKGKKALVLFLRSNHSVEFVFGVVDGGLIRIGDDSKSYYAYEEGAVYFYKHIPFIVVFEWRLSPLGGSAEKFAEKNYKLAGGDEDKEFAKNNGLLSFAQQTTIRALENAEILKGEDVKKKKLPIGLILVGGVIVIYLLGKSAGWF